MIDALGLEAIAPVWLWIIAATIFGIGEIVAPGLFLMWVGAAAALTGVLTAALGLPVVGQFLVFAVAAFASIYASRYLAAKSPVVSADPLLNDRAARMVGAIVTAVAPVDGLQGRVKVGDSIWSARGATAAIGDRLRVVSLEGNILIVETV